ncbi:MAG: 16S rRNA (cytidine(1402)-2'-O)-methyltransferase [Pelosinus sp.]|nr:16S rRNA (cytidine(1402)-2'-O)-methyltransferase [Pelosinus sp.]
MSANYGKLYLCATPIGNLEDISYRAVRILTEVAAIAAEDTRHTRKLLTHFDIHTPLISYHEFNKVQRGPELVERLLNGEDLAVVSDAGVPGISDPGADLAKLAAQAGITVVPVPGANAALSALVCSGLDTTSFTFVGFLPKANKSRREILERVAVYPHTLIFYESPHRLRTTLKELSVSLGDRQMAAARELTKKFEEFIRGSISETLVYFSEHEPRGEFTLIVAGQTEKSEAVSSDEDRDEAALLRDVAKLIDNGINKKDAIRMVASQYGIPKREVYQAAIKL